MNYGNSHYLHILGDISLEMALNLAEKMAKEADFQEKEVFAGQLAAMSQGISKQQSINYARARCGNPIYPVSKDAAIIHYIALTALQQETQKNRCAERKRWLCHLAGRNGFC